jgi:hypothetical protein
VKRAPATRLLGRFFVSRQALCTVLMGGVGKYGTRVAYFFAAAP